MLKVDSEQPMADHASATAPTGPESSTGVDPLRVLHLVTRLGFGGLEVEILNLVGGLERLGFAQAVCCLRDAGELAADLPAAVPSRELGGGRLVALSAARWFRAWRPDIIHVRNGWAWPDAAVAWLLAGRPGRLVFSFHGWDRVGRMPRRRAFLYRQLARITPALATISAATAERFAAESGIDPARFVVLDSGIDMDQFRPRPRVAPTGRLVLGCVGRLDPIKAHDVLIEAFAQALDGGRRDLELRLIGDGLERANLERLVAARGLEDRVRLLGMRRDIAAQVRELDLFVLASHREGRPIAIMEALACGVPVIATAVGSVPGLIEPGRTGLLVEPGDRAGLTAAINTLADDPERRDRFGREARRFAVLHLSVDRMAEQYAAFYRDVARLA